MIIIISLEEQNKTELTTLQADFEKRMADLESQMVQLKKDTVKKHPEAIG